MKDIFCFITEMSSRSVGVCWRQSNPPRFQNPNRPNMKRESNYPAVFQINKTPPPINEKSSLLCVSQLCAGDRVDFFCVGETEGE